eukprot:820386-Rhodomonas_salina.1
MLLPTLVCTPVLLRQGCTAITYGYAPTYSPVYIRTVMGMLLPTLLCTPYQMSGTDSTRSVLRTSYGMSGTDIAAHYEMPSTKAAYGGTSPLCSYDFAMHPPYGPTPYAIARPQYGPLGYSPRTRGSLVPLTGKASAAAARCCCMGSAATMSVTNQGCSSTTATLSVTYQECFTVPGRNDESLRLILAKSEELGLGIVLRTPYAVSGTALCTAMSSTGVGCRVLGLCYAMSSTDVPFGALGFEQLLRLIR